VDLAPGRPTSEGLVELLGEVDLSEKSVGIQLYGKPNPEFCSALESMGAHVTTVQVYDYAPASDRARILSFIGMLLDDPVDVLTITSSPQLTSLFDVSDEAGLSERLVRRLNEDVAVAVIGEVADRALLDRGIQAKICPRSPKMAPLAQAIADYYRSEEV
jgi:uroporphyrinogen-III synthase